MEMPRMYTELAGYWPLFSDLTDYAAEAEHWCNALQRKGRK